MTVTRLTCFSRSGNQQITRIGCSNRPKLHHSSGWRNEYARFIRIRGRWRMPTAELFALYIRALFANIRPPRAPDDDDDAGSRPSSPKPPKRRYLFQTASVYWLTFRMRVCVCVCVCVIPSVCCISYNAPIAGDYASPLTLSTRGK